MPFGAVYRATRVAAIALVAVAATPPRTEPGLLSRGGLHVFAPTLGALGVDRTRLA